MFLFNKLCNGLLTTSFKNGQMNITCYFFIVSLVKLIMNLLGCIRTARATCDKSLAYIAVYNIIFLPCFPLSTQTVLCIDLNV